MSNVKDSLFDPVAFGARVKAVMQKRGLSYREAAEEMNMDQATVHRVTHGLSPSVESYLRLVSWLSRQKGKI